MKRSVPIIKKKFDLVVCGGGMPGICAAIQGARKGLKTALIHNRGVLGGECKSGNQGSCLWCNWNVGV